VAITKSTTRSLNSHGKKALASFTKTYGSRGAQVFFATLNAGKIPRNKVLTKAALKRGPRRTKAKK